MSENNTERINGSRSFEEQVFARFDVVDRRFDGIEVRIERHEMKQLDTKPIWEQALIAIAETNAAMRNGFAIMGNAIDQINARLDVMDKRFDGVDAGLKTLSTELNDGLRGVERKIEVLNQDLLELKADQRYVDSRLQKIESGSKPS